MLFIQLTFLIKRKIFLLANKNYINYGLFFLSKSIGGKARGAKGCTPYSTQPHMPPSCSCTLLFVCPLCAQSREGVGHCLQVWVHALVHLPPLHIHRGQGTASVPVQPLIRAPPLHSSQGEGEAQLPSLYASPVVYHPACKSEGGWCCLQVCPSLVHLAHKRGRPCSPSTHPLFTCHLCAETQVGGHGFACVHQFAWPFCIQLGAHWFPFPHGHSFVCHPCTQTGGGGGPAMPLLGLGVALVCHHCVREGEGGAKGGGFPSPHGPVLATPSQLHAPPWFIHNWGTKKGVWAPSHSHRVPLLGLRIALALSSAQRGCKGGSAHPLPILTCTPSLVAPLLHMVNGVYGQTRGRGSAQGGGHVPMREVHAPPPLCAPCSAHGQQGTWKGGVQGRGLGEVVHQ